MSLDLSICIVSMNHSAVLKNCINSIYNNPPKKYSFEIVVVDNCSTDDTKEWMMVLAKDKPNLIFIQNDKIKNFAENNNIAVKNTNGKYLLILNPDTIVHENTLDSVLDYLKNKADVGVVGCKLLYEEGTFQESARRFITLRYMLFNRLNTWGIYNNKKILDDYIMSKPTDRSAKEVDWVLGAFMLIPKSVFYSVGMFDERFKLYAEDADICYRIKKDGYKIIYLPTAKVTHLYARHSAKRILSKAAFFQVYTAILFYAKHHWKIVI